MRIQRRQICPSTEPETWPARFLQGTREMSERIPSKLEVLVEKATEATVEPAGMFFSTKRIPRSEVESIARTAINAFCLNLEDAGVVMKIDVSERKFRPTHIDWETGAPNWEEEPIEQPSQSLPPESEVDAMAEKLTKMQEERSDEPQWMKNDRERDTMVENGLHNMNKPLGYGEVAVACDDPAQD
jgi:hypothetical protein